MLYVRSPLSVTLRNRTAKELSLLFYRKRNILQLRGSLLKGHCINSRRVWCGTTGRHVHSLYLVCHPTEPALAGVEWIRHTQGHVMCNDFWLTLRRGPCCLWRTFMLIIAIIAQHFLSERKLFSTDHSLASGRSVLASYKMMCLEKEAMSVPTQHGDVDPVELDDQSFVLTPRGECTHKQQAKGSSQCQESWSFNTSGKRQKLTGTFQESTAIKKSPFTG